MVGSDKVTKGENYTRIVQTLIVLVENTHCHMVGIFGRSEFFGVFGSSRFEDIFGEGFAIG